MLPYQFTSVCVERFYGVLQLAYVASQFRTKPFVVDKRRVILFLPGIVLRRWPIYRPSIPLRMDATSSCPDRTLGNSYFGRIHILGSCCSSQLVNDVTFTLWPQPYQINSLPVPRIRNHIRNFDSWLASTAATATTATPNAVCIHITTKAINKHLSIHVLGLVQFASTQLYRMHYIKLRQRARKTVIGGPTQIQSLSALSLCLYTSVHVRVCVRAPVGMYVCVCVFVVWPHVALMSVVIFYQCIDIVTKTMARPKLDLNSASIPVGLFSPSANAGTHPWARWVSLTTPLS